MFKAYKYRIYPTNSQSVKIDQTIGVCRLVYNLALEVKIRAYQSAGIILTAYDIQKQLIGLREVCPWLSVASRGSLDYSIAGIDRAFKGFFNGRGYPNYKKRKSGGSFTVNKDNRKVDFASKMLTIPKIDNIPIVLSRTFEGQIRSITISKTTTGKYFASVLVKIDQPECEVVKPCNAVGIDLGISHFATLSTGIKIDNQRFLQINLDRLKALQRRASKKDIGSKNHKKALRRVSILHDRITNQRQDFLHKLSTELIRDSQTDTICVENLAIGNMIKVGNLSKSISDVSWAEFVRQLEYKGRWYGKNIIKVDRFFASSKTCSSCGHKVDELPLSVREWICQCGATHDRDINAAINIRNSGLGKSGVPVEQSALMGCDEVGSQLVCQKDQEIAKYPKPITSNTDKQ